MSIERKALKRLGVEQKTLNKQELADLTKNILHHTNIISYEKFDPSVLSENIYYKVIYEEHAILFEREGAESFELATQLIQNDSTYASIISEGRIYKEYEKFIIKNVLIRDTLSDDNIVSMIGEFLKELRTSIAKYTVAMPIEHLALSDLPEVTLGNVRLASFKTLNAEHEDLSNFILTGDETKIWADVVIEARSEERKAIQSGEHEIQRIINLLRIYIPITSHKEHHKKIGLSKYELKQKKSIRIDDQGKIGLIDTNLGPFGDYIFNEKKLNELRDHYCLNEICGILSKDPSSRSKLEKSIIMAVRYLGLGVDEDIISEKFIKYAIALECLLVEGKGEKTDPLAKRAAFILGKTISECDEIENKVRALYDIRSTIVHQGVEEEDEDIIEKLADSLYSYTMGILLELTEKTIGADKWDSIESLVKEMDIRMYSR